MDNRDATGMGSGFRVQGSGPCCEPVSGKPGTRNPEPRTLNPEPSPSTVRGFWNLAQAEGSPAFLITIDTEGDNLWARPRTITTENARFLPRFQALCDRHGLPPVWLTNYEMACCPAFVQFGRDVVRRGTGEIGMHLHAWNSPPLVPLTRNDAACHPYLIEYPEGVCRDKIRLLTDLLEDRFETKIVSHRAGRWAFDATYARLLREHGYSVDCSVTPHRSWTSHTGDPRRCGGTDYTGFPTRPYRMSTERIDQPGDSSLLEVPVTIVKTRFAALNDGLRRAPSLVRRSVHRLLPSLAWLRPTGRNLRGMLAILHKARQEQWPCVEFMLHSSELMPGGNPTFRTEADVQRLYDHLEILFAEAAVGFEGMTLRQFHDAWMQRRGLHANRKRGVENGDRIDPIDRMNGTPPVFHPVHPVIPSHYLSANPPNSP